MYNLTCTLYLILIQGIPLAVLAVPFIFFRAPVAWIISLFMSAPAYTLSFVLVAGLLSRRHLEGVVPGRFPRQLSHPTYRARRLYGLCWTSVYYHKPLYAFCLSVPALRTLLFRLFGYRGTMDFTIYPDTWIRDLPLLDIRPGAYLANRATLGTNMPMRNGSILVDSIRIGSRAVVGHLAMIAAGAEVGDGAEIGPGAVVGIRARVGARAVIGGRACVSHRSVVGGRSHVGISAHIATAGVVGEDEDVPEGRVVTTTMKGPTPALPAPRGRVRNVIGMQ